VSTDQSAVGRTGTLIIPPRGAGGPGEVLVKVRGGTEAYLAWSEQPLPKGTTVLVFDARGERALDVMEWTDEPEGELQSSDDEPETTPKRLSPNGPAPSDEPLDAGRPTVDPDTGPDPSVR
jgi:hypothetical protein